MSEAQVVAFKPVPNRGWITLVTLAATLLYSIDMTIANVALPHMQAAVSASPEQITWALTSYIIAAAITTPLTGWLVYRLGRKQLFLVSIAGFTITSMACGLATNLPELVIFRFLQGMSGASLMPQSQAILLDINPPEKQGRAMALWSAGTGLGPILGPILGGYFTDHISWRWCFFINLPFGIAALIGTWIFISGEKGGGAARKFDFLGFLALSLFVGAAQLFLDRGPGEDWFSSPEIWAYTIVGAMGLWVFITHSLTTANPFFDLKLIRDRNFITALTMAFFVGIVLFSTLALIPPMLQTLMGYPAYLSGLVTVPRGVGMAISLMLVARVPVRVDTRLVLMVGFIISSVALTMMMHFDLSMDERIVIISGGVQGFAMGMILVPLTTLAFVTVPGALRPEASALFNLIRNLGSSVGISVMTALLASNGQAMHATLAGKIIPGDQTVRAALPAAMNPATAAGITALNDEVTRQATMVAYVNDFKFMLFITLACIPGLLLLKRPRYAAASREI